MFNNLTKEMFCFSLIPVAVLALITLVVLFIGRKNEKDYYKYTYIINVLMIIMISLVLPFITGYAIWIIVSGRLASNILYIVILGILIIALIILLIVICRRLYRIFDDKKRVS